MILCHYVYLYLVVQEPQTLKSKLAFCSDNWTEKKEKGKRKRRDFLFSSFGDIVGLIIDEQHNRENNN